MESTQIDEDLLRIINYLPIKTINAELKEKEINTDDMTSLETVEVYANELIVENRKKILNLYKYSMCPLSIRLVKYKKSSESPLFTTTLGDWNIYNSNPLQCSDKVIYKLERIGSPKIIKDGWKLKEITNKETLLVIDRFNENILEIRGPVRSLKSVVDIFSRKLLWEDYKILGFSDEELKNILDELNALVEEMQLDISEGQLLTSLKLSNRGNENGIDYNKSMKIIIGDENEHESEIDLNQEATGNNYWFKGSNYTAYISKNGTFHTKSLLTEYQIEQIVNKILEVKYKSIMEVKASFLEADDEKLFKLYKIFVNNTSYNSLSRFSSLYFAKRTNISNEQALKFLLNLVKNGTIEIKYEVLCSNPYCNRITYSGSSIEEVKKFALECPYCGNSVNSNEINDENINIYFKASGVVNIPSKSSLTEKDKAQEDTEQSILELYKYIDELVEECNDFFADSEYYKIKENIDVLMSMKIVKAYESADLLKERYKSILAK